MSYTSKLIPIILATLIIVPSFSFAQELTQNPLSDNAYPQRFTLFQGKYGVYIDGRASEPLGIFKIDTYTGDVWLLVSGSKDGQFTQGWVKIKN